MINIDDLTLGQLKELRAVLGDNNSNSNKTLNTHIGEKVIIRTYSAGVWFGTLAQKSDDEVILENARRMWRWRAVESISLSGVAVHGIDKKNSRIAPAVPKVWLKAIEIITLNKKAIKTIEEAEDDKAR